MAFRFFRRIKLLPGVTLNLSKGLPSLSVGPRGAKVTAGTRGLRGTVGIPGSGLSYSKSVSTGTRSRQSAAGKGNSALKQVPDEQQRDPFEMGLFKRLITSPAEKAFVAGSRYLSMGNEEAALARFTDAVDMADAAFLAMCVCFKLGRNGDAMPFLERALDDRAQLGKIFAKYGFTPTISLPITEEVKVDVAPDQTGLLLMAVEAYQEVGKRDKAMKCMKELRTLWPDDISIKLSYVELMMEGAEEDQDILHDIVKLTSGFENDSFVHTGLLLYKGRALRQLGLHEGAKEVLTVALRRKKDRPKSLLSAIRYERALLYEDMDQPRKARSEFEKLYADDPDFKDLAKRVRK